MSFRFYSSRLQLGTLTLDAEEARHITKVLRKRPGDEIEITDGKGNLAIAKIIQIDPKSCRIEVSKIEFFEKNGARLHIAVSPTKNPERMEWLLEKAVEVGVDEFHFPITSRTERVKFKEERLEKIAVSALKQSKSLYKAQINPPIDFASFLKNLTQNTERFIAWLGEEEPGPHLFQAMSKDKDVLILIGPEGDFSEDEVKMAKTYNFKEVSLGDSRLRTETAALYSCIAFALINYR
jgi:16S rRNA (uracil1498-N3)-methyltransferase